ncbi:HAD superfamily hydrolase (TIGR01450 family) [Mumia flava]|uniref:HAD superfamily hydrolase (TIGR01450 family) n=1 Tax=Mumia flava TaxID=1348852 RepID=A0A2M9B5Y9_9ACTN|nr:HAD-IIA family hydrolase [Mumia flava]PJJ53359.1 HAD superfamily hydrolase (TIGR01450 family) [Mumia flava]
MSETAPVAATPVAVPSADGSEPPSGRARPVERLLSVDAALTGVYDVAMLDLDGVVYRGDHAVDHAAAVLHGASGEGMRLGYVTNNASRTPADVVAKLRGIGMPVDDDGVVTSAQAAGRLVAAAVPRGARVLVVGGRGLEAALTEHGLVPVRSLADDPAAVVQGFDPTLSWPDLAEGAYAVERGLPWVASNTDMSIPTARGIAPGNGTMVAAVAAATGATPQVAGKPYPPLFDETVLRIGGERPLVVGDRLDTDIEGAVAVGADSLLVLTGVSRLADVAAAEPLRRPTFIAADLRGLSGTQPPVGLEERPSGVRATCATVTVEVVDGEVRPAPGTPAADEYETVTALLRACVAAAWATTARGGPVPDVAAVADALDGWSVR